jgi:acyl-CoA reductase-like NAD-dependent aldehyde dehydrogenase
MSQYVRCIEQPVTLFLDGALSESMGESTIDVIDPSNGRRCLSIPAGCDADVDRAVLSARRAFESDCWSHAPPSFRKRTLHAFADLIEREAATLDALDAGEMGKPVRETFANAAAAAELMRFCAESVDKIMGDVYVSDVHSFVVQRRVARGVVAAIVPWNFPTYVAVLKIAPALAAGNSVILKPSELSSRSAVRLAHLGTEAGIPPGVLNVVPGVGEIVGRALGLHQDIDMLTFTGSTAVGKRMLQYSGQSNMKVVMTECGGKSPQIVFDDGVDLDAAIGNISQSLLTNQGQICSVGSRLLVQQSIEPIVLDKLASCLRPVKMGAALDAETTFGPVASAEQSSRVMQYIESGRRDGAELVAGGHMVMQETGGYFVEPTVFRSVSPEAKIAQEEIFGPVLSIIPFSDEAEAIRIANGTVYGLVAFVWTARLSTGMRMAKALRSSVFVNAAPLMGEGAGHAASAEPARQSGIGAEGGLAGMENYLRRQLVGFNHV